MKVLDPELAEHRALTHEAFNLIGEALAPFSGVPVRFPGPGRLQQPFYFDLETTCAVHLSSRSVATQPKQHL